jgi:hypothetical protein
LAARGATLLHKFIFMAVGVGLLPLMAEHITQELLVRLTTPITSTAKAGARFSSIVTGCAHADCVAILPAGSTIYGTVRQVQSVGIGIRRERASLTLDFEGCAMPEGGSVPCRSELLSIDNAREAVTKGNRIEGILAANHPHSYLGGLWVRPTSALLPRALSGLTGAGRMIYTGVSPHPLMAGAIIVSRLAVFRLPDPEIHIPAGTELIVHVSGETQDQPAVSSVSTAPDNLVHWLNGVPEGISLPDTTLAADIVNLVFRGSNADLVLAFLGAGWTTADPLNRRTFARSYGAIASLSPYPTAPVSPLRYLGRLPDLVFQKSFNSMTKRHHIRLWKVDSPDGPIWVGAATHDVSIVFDWKRLMLTHRIDPAIDRERDKVLADLTFAGCVSHATRVERPELATRTGGRISTDGALHLIDSQLCERPSPVIASALGRKKTPFGKVMLRRTILESRQYLLRGNGYYWAFRGLRSRPVRALFSKSATALAGLRPEIGKTCWRCGSGLNRRMRVLQTLALPLGYRTPRLADTLSVSYAAPAPQPEPHNDLAIWYNLQDHPPPTK